MKQKKGLDLKFKFEDEIRKLSEDIKNLKLNLEKTKKEIRLKRLKLQFFKERHKLGDYNLNINDEYFENLLNIRKNKEYSEMLKIWN